MEIWEVLVEKQCPESNSRVEYDKVVQWLQDHKSWGAYWAVVEDGYEDTVNWRALREKFEGEAV